MKNLLKDLRHPLELIKKYVKLKDPPIAGYDNELDSPYIEYPDGRRAYPDEE